jgi:DNA replication licensing factor MCM6
MVAISPDRLSLPPSSAPFPTFGGANGFSSPGRIGTPRRATVDPLALDDGAERIQEDEQDETNRPKRPKARNLINNDVPQVRDSSGEAIVLLMEQFISE